MRHNPEPNDRSPGEVEYVVTVEFTSPPKPFSARHLLSLTSWTRDDLLSLFARADEYGAGRGPRYDGSALLFFPPSSLRTRVSFEQGVAEMGLQPITFPPESLDKGEDLADVVGYLASWARVAVVRHRDIAVLERMADAGALPVVNAMTDMNHPCEVLSDLYALSQDTDVFNLRFLFVGADGNIARAWWEAGQAFGLDIRQSCPAPLRVEGMPWDEDLRSAIRSADVVLTDGPGDHIAALAGHRITAELLQDAPPGVRLAPSRRSSEAGR